MRFQLVAALAGLSSIAVAQYNGLPKCAQACVGNSLVDYGCSNIQAECICKNKPLIDSLACCVGKSCTNSQDVKDTETFASAICAPYSVTLPASATCASSSGSAAAASQTSSGSASSTPASASASGPLATGGAGTNSANGTQATGAGSSGSSSSSSSTPRSTGGAPVQTMAAGLGAAAFGLLAVL